jgi:Ca-activated chloride channel family protein
LIVSRVNPILRFLSHEVGGEYLEAKSTPKQTAEMLSDTLDGKKRVIEKRTHNYLELYQLPLTIALLLFMMLHTRAREYLKF